MAEELFAISVKQPWAALLAIGMKTIEIRTWKTNRRGPLLIHASRVPDSRKEAWDWITTPQLKELANLGGGIIAVGELCDCWHYTDAEKFHTDHQLHLNPADWFVENGMYGLVFRGLRPVEFFPAKGNTFFFPVAGFDLKLPPRVTP